MDTLKIKSDQSQSLISLKYNRYLVNQIDWNWRLTGIIGARGTGKTTLLLQRLKKMHGLSSEAIYITLDDLFFSQNTLTDFVVQFKQKGGIYLYIDEVHKYKNWARELKNIYDLYPDLYIVFTGSSIIDILKQDVDLSRRAVMYHLHGLSFREFLNFIEAGKFKTFSIEEILSEHPSIALEITKIAKPYSHFEHYLRSGYFPYFIENEKLFFRRLEQTLHLTLESDISFIEGFNPKYISKIKQLLYILSVNVPFKPNIVKLAEKTGIHRNTLITYLHYLEKAQVINLVYPSGIGTSILQKPEKVYLENTNFSYLLSSDRPDIGTLRETFFLNQLKCNNIVKVPKQGDFEINDKYVFEIGGKSKTEKQIYNIPNSYIVSDEIETGAYNRIPLWLFGFLY